MNSGKHRSSPPFQFGLRSLLAFTAVVAIFCSLLSVLGWSGELFVLMLPLAAFVFYQFSYAFISRWITRGAWEGANHALTAALAIALLLMPILLLLLGLLFWA